MTERLYLRKTLLFLSALFLCARICSSIYLFAFAAHHCTGHGCPVCAELRVCKALTCGNPASSAESSSRILLPAPRFVRPCGARNAFWKTTPVSLKVRLLD